MKSDDLCFEIPASKSIFNRALLVKSYNSKINILGHTSADDVLLLDKALNQKDKSIFQAGLGGTTFRFLVLRLSRMNGEFKILAEEKLLERPQQELKNILDFFNVESEWSKDYILVKSQGWQAPNKVLKISHKESTQFASSVLLNSWDLDFDLDIEFSDVGLSEGYWHMTKQLCVDFGMKIIETSFGLRVVKNQKPVNMQFEVESDMSSAFSIASLAAILKTSSLEKIPPNSMQPDILFLDIFKLMNINWIRKSERTVCIEKSEKIMPVQISIGQAPDLFPVLAILCSKAAGKSDLRGAPQLQNKESNRIAKISELLNLMEIKNEIFADGISIYGNPNQIPKAFTFSPDHDHRLVMAAYVAKALGHKVNLENSHVVSKSFPEFFSMAQRLGC